MNMPRPEHPNPQWERKNWRTLNGEWQFEIDNSESALDKKYYENGKELNSKIIVPFCPESKLSGVQFTDFMNAVCYKKKVDISEKELENNVILHFGAVDYIAKCYVNGNFVGEHMGGYTSFSFDITKYLNCGENTLFVYAVDHQRNGTQPRGKQSALYASHGCDYTRTTGIWQTVWLEFVPKHSIKFAKFYPDAYNSALTVIGQTSCAGNVTAQAFYNGKSVGKKSVVSDGSFTFTLELSETHLWQPGDGKLYDLVLTFDDDVVNSYFGLRSLGIDGMKFLINGKSVFQRLVLDQGFYPDGIYTASDDKALENDILISMAAGFNGARLHEKVFEPRFLYHCDKLGYIVWGEFPNWGFDCHNPHAVEYYSVQWTEAVNRDFNHPSIVGWCPFNETWGYYEQTSGTKVLSTVYHITKAIDSTRPCIDTSGNFHVVTDIYDIHDYDQNPETFKERYAEFARTGELPNTSGRPFYAEEYKYEKGSMPVFISEYGGIAWNRKEGGWGYGNAPQSEKEFLDRYKGLTEALLNNKNMFGFCYTQLYDIEQEQNGLYSYDRVPKFDMNLIKAITSKRAAIED